MSLEHVPVRFQRAVALHLYKNLGPDPVQGTPLILGIHGAPGEGKTFQCEIVFREVEAHVEYISGGELEHHTAGEPAARIRRAYESAAKQRMRQPNRLAPAVVFINDIDAGIGDWGDKVQYTVNRQQIFSELMHLADYPHDVHGMKIPRVPIVVTANDISKLYRPFTRLGRMTMFEWRPTSDERMAAVSGIFPELTSVELQKLVSEFSDQSVSFFSALKAGLNDDSLWGGITQWGVRQSFQQLTESRILVTPDIVSLSDLISLGRTALASTEPKDHMESR